MQRSIRPPLPSVIDLLDRISQSQVRYDCDQYLQRLKYRFRLVLLILLPLLCFFECHNRIYNAWFGPFHLTDEQFIEQWKIYTGAVQLERSLLAGLLSLEREYLQIELGENQIENDPKQLLFVYYRHPSLNQHLYTFHPLRASDTVHVPKDVFVKLPTSLASHYHQRLPYRFERLSNRAILCILRQLGIPDPIDVMKSDYIKIIQRIYDRNPTEFNMKVIHRCGIVLGYFYPAQSETVFRVADNEPYKISSFVAAFNASSSYTPYFTWTFLGLLLVWLFMPHLACLRRWSSPEPTSTYMKDMLRSCHIPSLEILDHLLLCARDENNHRNQLFLLQDRYLVLFQVNLNEHDREILRRFVSVPPFVLIDVFSITEIGLVTITISNLQTPMTTFTLHLDESALIWLHRRLLLLNTGEQARYVVHPSNNQHVSCSSYGQRARLAFLIGEEERIQRDNNQSDPESIWQGNVAASAEFIAQFRFEGPDLFSSQFPETVCSICLETMQPGDHYSRWPCPAQHTFHHECMLKALRRQHQCPLCRHAVEPY